MTLFEKIQEMLQQLRSKKKKKQKTEPWTIIYVQVRRRCNGEGTLGVAELAEDHVVGLLTCEGGVDVVGVVSLLVRGGAQVVLHGDQVVELSVLLGVREKGEVEEDGEDQVEEEREEGEVKEKRSCMTMNVDEMRLKNTLSHEVHVTQTSRGVTKQRRSKVVQLARVGVVYLLLM